MNSLLEQQILFKHPLEHYDFVIKLKEDLPRGVEGIEKALFPSKKRGEKKYRNLQLGSDELDPIRVNFDPALAYYQDMKVSLYCSYFLPRY